MGVRNELIVEEHLTIAVELAERVMLIQFEWVSIESSVQVDNAKVALANVH